MANTYINADALKSEIREAIITRKANACPMVIRLAWHASGSYSKEDNSGGSDGYVHGFVVCRFNNTPAFF